MAKKAKIQGVKASSSPSRNDLVSGKAREQLKQSVQSHEKQIDDDIWAKAINATKKRKVQKTPIAPMSETDSYYSDFSPEDLHKLDLLQKNIYKMEISGDHVNTDKNTEADISTYVKARNYAENYFKKRLGVEKSDDIASAFFNAKTFLKLGDQVDYDNAENKISKGYYNIDRDAIESSNIPNELKEKSKDKDWFYKNEGVIAKAILADYYKQVKSKASDPRYNSNPAHRTISDDDAWSIAASAYNRGLNAALDDHNQGRGHSYYGRETTKDLFRDKK